MDETKDRPGQSGREEFGAEVECKESRKLKARREKHKNIWFGLGMFGLVGWSVTVPTVALTALGVWMDSKSSGKISWTLTLLFAGIVLGCLNAWFWIKRETENNG